MHRSLAILKRPQVCIEHSLIGSRARGPKSDNRKNSVDFRVARDYFLRLATDIARVGERRSLWRLHDEHQVTLIIFRDEGARDALIKPIRTAQQGKKEQQRRQPPVHRAAYRASIETCAAVKNIIEQLEETPFRAFAMFPQKNSRK